MWIVREGDGATVAEVVLRAGGDARAIADGRVFLGRTRVKTGALAVRPGDELSITGAPTAPPVNIEILVHEDDMVAVNKPAGIPTIPDHGGAAHALIAQTARALGVFEQSLHPTSRLDREVSGVVVFARGGRARDRLKTAREEHQYVRRYVAIAATPPPTERGTWDAPIGRAKDPRHRVAFGKEALPATTHFATIARAGTAALLAVAPVTGRTHQIRVHASHAGAPLLGDRTYGGPGRITLPSGRVLAVERIALHAARIVIPRASGAPLTIDAPIPAVLADLWLALGGDAHAWDLARTCDVGPP